MGMLDRYKKKGGFGQLLILIETSGKTKQEQFLSLIAAENLNWEVELKKKMLTIEKILNWPKEPLNEIFTRVQPLTLAVALRHFDAKKKDEILGFLTQSDQRKISLLIDETNPSAAEISTCIGKIVIEVRSLINQGIIKLEKFNPDLAIPENFEDILNSKSFESPPTQVSQLEVEKSSNDNDVALDFSDPKTRKSSSEANHKAFEEIEHLKKKITSLNQEVATLRVENSVMKNKLDQIKKIA